MADEVAVQTQSAAPAAERPVVDKPEVLIFGKYGTTGIVIEDAGLAKYIDLESMMVPHSGGKHANMWFGKSKLSIVERLINNIMRTEKYTGKKLKAYRAVSDAFDIIAAKTKQNPVQVLVEALQSAAPREEVTRLQFGGISVPKAVDISPRGGSTSHSGTSVPASLSHPQRTRKQSRTALPTRSCLPPKAT